MINDPKKFAKKLCDWYEREKRALPFRLTRDPYAILVAETMLQQTRMETVVDYYERFLAVFPTVESLARADADEVMKLWEGLGYYRRAQNLHKTAQLIVSDHGGSFPTDPESLRSLPGIGDYTAAALAAIAFGKRTPAVDGNVMRIMARIAGIADDPDKTRVRRRVRDMLAGPMAHADPRTFTEALMELGALVCKRRPLCERCPLADYCFAYKQDKVDAFPVVGAKKAKPTEDFRTFVVKNEQGVLLEKRTDRGLLAGLYTLPQYGKDLDGALEDLQKDFGIRTGDIRFLGTFTHAFTHKVWRMEAFLVETDTARGGFHDVKDMTVAIARAHGKILDVLKEK